MAQGYSSGGAGGRANISLYEGSSNAYRLPNGQVVSQQEYAQWCAFQEHLARQHQGVTNNIHGIPQVAAQQLTPQPKLKKKLLLLL